MNSLCGEIMYVKKKISIKKIERCKAGEIMIYDVEKMYNEKKCKCDCNGWNTGKCNEKCKKCIDCSKKCMLIKKLLNSWPLEYKLVSLYPRSDNKSINIEMCNLCIDEILWYINNMLYKSDIKIEICDECCQYKSEVISCVCSGGERSSKKIMLVSGCSVYKNGMRCKNVLNNEEVCDKCYKIGLESSDGILLKKIFNNESKKVLKKK